MPRSHRTTARGILFLLFMGVFAGTAQAAASVPAITAFPVVGNVHYTNDFGDPRPQGPHEGNDIMSVRHQPAVAFERGTVEKHVGSSLGTCMLYLHGDSGMTYVYIHLNNDLTMQNDNDGGCRNGVSWAPGLKNGQTVRRGQLVGFVGDSGDADGIQPHLHFEVRKPGGRAINPFTYLNKAKHLLYPRPAATDPVSLILNKAKVLSADPAAATLTVTTKRIRVLPSQAGYPFARNLVLSVPTDATLERVTSTGRSALTLSALRAGMILWIGTKEFVPSWKTQRAAPGVLAAGAVTLR
jgi:Peptidase family M23